MVLYSGRAVLTVETVKEDALLNRRRSKSDSLRMDDMPVAFKTSGVMALFNNRRDNKDTGNQVEKTIYNRWDNKDATIGNFVCSVVDVGLIEMGYVT